MAHDKEAAQAARVYTLTVAQTLQLVGSTSRGLQGAEADARLQTDGPNELPLQLPNPWLRLLRQFHNPLVYVLLLAAGITLILTLGGHDMLADTLVIIGVVLFNAALGFVQEGKAEGALIALQQMMAPECTALRDGGLQTIAARELVVGDVVQLAGGDKVPADLRVISVKEASTNEASLTGESTPVHKQTEALAGEALPPADQTNMLFAGTFLTSGVARGVVVATAGQTEFGRLAVLVGHTKHAATPLQRRISEFTRTLLIAVMVVGLLNFFLGVLTGYSLVYSFLASVSLVVAAIPEMLPMIVTAILALAATVMARRNALVRELPAAETLGCTTVICSDKTGTLTRNEMTVVEVWSAGQRFDVSGVGYEIEGEFRSDGSPVAVTRVMSLYDTLVAGALCNDAELHVGAGGSRVVGDPTEAALLVAATKAGVDLNLPRLDEVPFDSERMYMATLHDAGDHTLLLVKGSPERVLELCTEQAGAAQPEPLNHEQVHVAGAMMAKQALRVLGMASKRLPKGTAAIAKSDLVALTFLGLQGMIDPPREEAIDAIARCGQAGIRTVMITGDHLDTARAVGALLGIGGEQTAALTGSELAQLDDEALYEAVKRVSIYARAAPEHKLRIARTLQAHGHVVAMTGDGVNDAPALRAADIGIAMGITGTEVSKEASAMVLADDNFASIVGAVEEGRHAWNNLEKAILYTLPTNGGQALLVIGALLLAPWIPLFGERLPLEPIQILWINLFDSVFLTMPLMMEPKQRDLLLHPPRESNQRLASALLLQRVLLIGLTIALSGFAVYHHFGAAALVDGVVVDSLLLTQAQTAAFWAVLLVHFGFVLSARSIYDSAFSFNPLSNHWLLFGIVFSLVARLLPTFVPEVGVVFRTAEFPASWWWVILPCLLPGFLALELDKLIRRYLRSHR